MTSDRPIRWNRRVRAYIAFCMWLRRCRAALLGAGLSFEADAWGPLLTLNGTGSDGQPGSVTLRQCPICSAAVPEANEPYHERWHIVGSVIRQAPNQPKEGSDG